MISFYEFCEKINEEILRQINLQKAIARTGISPNILYMAKKIMTINDFLHNPPAEDQNAYALGLSKAVGDIYFQISKAFNMVNWHNAYKNIFGGNWINRTDDPDITKKFLEKALNDNRTIVFFLPNETLKTAEGRRYTKEEMEYFINHPEQLKKVIFVLGTYDLIDPKDYEKHIANDNDYPRDLSAQEKMTQNILRNPNLHKKPEPY